VAQGERVRYAKNRIKRRTNAYSIHRPLIVRQTASRGARQQRAVQAAGHREMRMVEIGKRRVSRIATGRESGGAR